MNSSAYENVSPIQDTLNSGVYRTINNILDVNGGELKIFCPLCVNSFEYKFSLFEHLRTFHNSFLSQAGNKTIRFEECPFCDAKFYGEHLTSKHALVHHSKVIRELFGNKNRSSKCSFCDSSLSKREFVVVKHIEELHMFEFEEEFKKMFSCDNGLEMTISELMNSSIQGNVSWEDVCMDTGPRKGHSSVEDFEEASRINCYDFSDLKRQLENITESQSLKKSILKDIKNSYDSPVSQKSGCQKSARRVLRFDIPDLDDEDKENSVLKSNLTAVKSINIDEHSLLCHDSKREICKLFSAESSENLCGEPQHASTPNVKVSKRKFSKIAPNFKSYIQQDCLSFEFQCGKCSKLFKDNLELVSHVKNKHKKFSFNVLQPCYRCGICNARFYKNHYLKKHHNLHKPY